MHRLNNQVCLHKCTKNRFKKNQIYLCYKNFPGERIKVKLVAQSGFFRGFVLRAENALVNDHMGKNIRESLKQNILTN